MAQSSAAGCTYRLFSGRSSNLDAAHGLKHCTVRRVRQETQCCRARILEIGLHDACEGSDDCDPCLPRDGWLRECADLKVFSS